MPDNDLVPGTGQVPPGAQSPDSNGQVPPASHEAPRKSDADQSPISFEDLPPQVRAEITKAREQAAKARVDAKRLAELEAAEAERANAALSEKERYDKQRTADQTRIAELETQLQEVRVGVHIDAAAKDLGLTVALARRLLATEWSALEFNEDGDPANVVELLTKAALECDIPIRGAGAPGATSTQQQPQFAAQSQQPSAVPRVGATNPTRGGRGQSAPPAKDPSQLARFGQGRELFKRQ